ncbi:MAG: DUF2892 domain-containing protein [Pyrinomonadaceae bacterium]|nr:DUF2892 domain-containing protein [Pyrinomonadaceae bacterium]
MTVDRLIHIMGGGFVFISVVLGYYVSSYFFLFAGFVGLNLFQSGFTGWCPMMAILRRLGVRDEHVIPAGVSRAH